MVWKEQVTRCDLGPDCFNNGAFDNGACNLFDEMPASDWRSPSRVLEVTIHRAYYPISEKLLHLVFDPFGEVEHVVILGGADPVLARVRFSSKQDAADAFGELHGQYLYTGCCQLDINWGSSQDVSCRDSLASSSSTVLQAATTSTIIEPNVSVIMSNRNTMTSSSSVPFPSIDAAMSTLDDHSSERLSAKAVPVSATLVACSSTEFVTQPVVVQPISILDIMVQDVNDKLQGPVASIIGQEVLVPSIADTASSASNNVPKDVKISTPANCSTECQVCAVGAPTSMIPPSARAASLLESTSQSVTLMSRKCSLDNLCYNPMLLHKDSLGGGDVFIKEQLRTCQYLLLPLDRCEEHAIDMGYVLHATTIGHRETTWVMWLKWERWPPMQVTLIGGRAEILLTPWPSFKMEDWVSVYLCFSLLGKPPWPPPVCQGCRCLLAVMVVSQEYMLIISGSIEYAPWDPGTMVHSFICLMLMYEWDLFLHKADSSYSFEGLCEILNLWKLLVRSDLVKTQFQCCSTVCSEFSMADSKQCRSKCSVVQREVPWLLYWDYGAIRFFGVTNVAAVLLPQIFILMPLKLCYGFLPHQVIRSENVKEKQLLLLLYGKNWQDMVCFKYAGCSMNCHCEEIFSFACLPCLLEGDIDSWSCLMDIISLVHNVAGYCRVDQVVEYLFKLHIIWEHMLFFSKFQALKVCYREAFYNGWHISDHFKTKNNRKRFQICGSFFLSLKKITESSSLTYVQFNYSNCIERACTQNTVMLKTAATFTRDGAACYVVLNYQQRHVSCLGFHCYTVTYTVFMTEPMTYDTNALVFKFSPQQLATCKEMRQVEILAVITEHNCLLICTGLLMEGAGCFLQAPWDPGGSEFLFDGNDGFSSLVYGLPASAILIMLHNEDPVQFWSSSFALGALHFSSYGWLMVLIRDMASLLLDTSGITFVLNLSIYRLEGKSDLKKGGMSGNVYMEMGRRMGYGLWRVGLCWTTTTRRKQQRQKGPSMNHSETSLLQPLVTLSSSYRFWCISDSFYSLELADLLLFPLALLLL